jgi:AcrR family transcriptional regulator
MTVGGAGSSTGRARVPNRWGEGERLRVEILDAAGRLLERSGGTEGVSLRAIAREAGVAASALYKHFHDRDELMWTLLDEVYTRLAEIMREARCAAPRDDPWLGLRATIDAYCRFATGAPHRYELLFRIGPSLPPPTHLDHHPMEPVMAAWREAVEAYHEVSPSGPLSSDEVAKLLWSSLHGQLGLWRNVVGHVSDAGELDGLRESMLLAVFGRT